MNLGRLGRGEYLAVLGGLLLALLMSWYATNPDNRNAQIDGVRGSVSGWEAFPILHWPLLAAAVAPAILAWIVARDHQLRPGWYVALLGCELIVVGGALRAGGSERPRKSPGVL